MLQVHNGAFTVQHFRHVPGGYECGVASYADDKMPFTYENDLNIIIKKQGGCMYN